MSGIGIGIGTHRLRFSDFINEQSILFGGSNQFINIDLVQVALAPTTVGTWSTWVKPVDATPVANESLISFGDTDANTGISLFISNTGQLVALARDTGVNQWVLQTDPAILSDNIWSHIAFVMDGIEAKLYLDSVFITQGFVIEADKTIFFNNLPGIDNGRIGNNNINNLGEVIHFNGNEDEVLFINRALTQPQVADIFNAGRPKDQRLISDGISYFRFDNDIVPVCTDFIGSNNGTYVNIVQGDIENDVP